MTAAKRRAWQRGRWAETLVVLGLRLTGHRVLARRYRTPVGEIDIVARRRKTLVFVEVKYRDAAGDTAAALGPRQRARIARAAGLFIAHHPEYADDSMRFDVILAARGRWPRRIKDAWQVEVQDRR